MIWKYSGTAYRLATQAETESARDEDGAPHVMFGCLCGKGVWSSKNLALSSGGQYTGARNIFFLGKWNEECACPPTQLRHIVCE